MPSPKLFIRRVVVDGELSYDQRFYPGLNVIGAVQTGSDIRSTNGCGKTAFVELIQHGFGKRHESKAKFHFSTIIDQLNKLWLEFETSEGVYTIERSLKDIFSAAKLHEGPYVPGMENSPAEIIKIDDMSSVLLGLIGIPSVAVNTRDGSPAQLTFPLLMRAFILHQEDSFAQILFKVEPETRKSDIIGFLTGITPAERFPLEEQLSQLKQQQLPLDNYVKHVTRFLVDNNSPSLLEAASKVDEARHDLELARDEQKKLQRSIIKQEAVNRIGRTDITRANLLQVKKEISELEDGFLGTKQEFGRIKELIASLKGDRQKSRHLQASTTQLSHVDFDMCPRCLQEINIEMQQRELSGRCSLCNRSLVVLSDALPKKVLKTEDLDLQIQEAEQILAAIKKELQTYDERLGKLQEVETERSEELESQLSAYVSPSIDKLVAQADLISERQAAYTQAKYILEQAESLERLREELNLLNSRIAETEDRLADANKAIRKRGEEFKQKYYEILRAVDFPKLKEVSIDSRTFMPNINGQLYIHQGLAFKGLATVCYHLALLELARKVETHFPKFLVIDSPNTGDLNEDNHTKLLRYLAQLNSKDIAEQDWQIILTTRHLIEELKPYLRDTVSSPGRMLLRKKG